MNSQNTITMKSNFPFPLIRSITQAGTEGLSENQAKSATLMNRIALISILLVGVFGPLTYMVWSDGSLIWSTLTESGLFVIALFLNKFRKYTLAGFVFVITNNIAVGYYSAIFGHITEVHLLIIFLFGMPFLVFHKLKFAIVGACIAAFTLIVCEFNIHYPFVQPLLSPDVQLSVRWLAVPCILILDIATVGMIFKIIYDKNIALTKANKKLEIANSTIKMLFHENNHELRRNVNNIYLITENLEIDTQANATQSIQPLVNALKATTGETILTINNVMDFAAIEAGKSNKERQLETIDVWKWLEGTASMYQPTASKKRGLIRLNIDAKMPYCIEIDKRRLGKIVYNILNNAIKFTAKESIIDIVAKPDGTRWLLKIKDEGTGIDKERIQKIFDPFETSGPNTIMEGTGLGLFIAKQSADDMGARIDVISSREGTVFTISFPLVIGNENQLVSTDALDTFSFNGTKVMIIDDDAMSRGFGRNLLQRMGCHVIVAETEQQALQLAKRTQVDIILCDLCLEEGRNKRNGLDLYHSLQQIDKFKSVPFIITSGSHTEKETVLKSGIRDFLLKPIEMTSLINIIKKYTSSDPSRVSTQSA